jgi:hypothetical protein
MLIEPAFLRSLRVFWYSLRSVFSWPSMRWYSPPMLLWSDPYLSLSLGTDAGASPAKASLAVQVWPLTLLPVTGAVFCEIAPRAWYLMSEVVHCPQDQEHPAISACKRRSAAMRHFV